MGDTIIIFSTAVIATATVIYSIFNYKMWIEIREQKRISKFSFYFDYLIMMDKFLREVSPNNPVEREVLNTINTVLMKQVMTSLISEFGSEPIKDFNNKVELALKEKQIDTSYIQKILEEIIIET